MHYTPDLKENVSLNAPIVNVVFCRQVPSKLCPQAELMLHGSPQQCSSHRCFSIGWAHRWDGASIRTGRGLGNVGLYLGQKPFAQVSFQFPGDVAISREKGRLEGNSTCVASA